MDLITRSAKTFYKERHMTSDQGVGIEELLFSTPDESTKAAFSLDRLISSPHGMTYRNATNQSLIRHFTPGTNTFITVPRASEKTPIDEDLEDSVAAGKEATDSEMDNIAANVESIVEDFDEGAAMTRAKQALDVPRTGIFNAKGVKGSDLGLGYDHNRDGGNDLVYDFTAGGASMSEALLNISNRLDAKGAPMTGRYSIMGANWRAEYGSDSGILEIMKANAANTVLTQQLFNQQFGNVIGLSVLAQFRPSGASSPMWILAYEPGVQYIAYEGATPEPFIPVTSVIAGSFDDKTYRVQRGVLAFDDSGKRVKVVNKLVVDSFFEKDATVTWIRGQIRHIYIYGNIDHTVESVGTFA